MTQDDNPPTISELIQELEAIQERHGDLPVVYITEMWHTYPDPSVEEGSRHGEGEPKGNITEKRVEL